MLRRELGSQHCVEQEAREDHDPWDEKLAKAIGTVEQGMERIETTDLLETVLGIHVSRQRYADWKRAGNCMRRLGWTGPKDIRIGGKVAIGYEREKK